MSRRRTPTVALVLQTVCEVLLEWGNRWMRQVCFFLGLGIGVALWTLWLAALMEAR